MKMKVSGRLICFLLISGLCKTALIQGPLYCQETLRHIQIKSNTLDPHPQVINLMYLEKAALSGHGIQIVSADSALSPTSHLALKHQALAAINGSFFDMEQGGSVAYSEKNNQLISSTRRSGQKWAVADSILNAAILLHLDSGLLIQAARPDIYYETSDKEAFVLVAGPLLLKATSPQRLPEMSFTHNRHPRTCIGITEDYIIFITVDGRSERAAGMSLVELQEFLIQLGCLDAINMDGGGSTTMWIREKGIVNEPSDQTGERPVANALIIQAN